MASMRVLLVPDGRVSIGICRCGLKRAGTLRSIHHESSSKHQNSESDVSVKFYPVPNAYVQLQWIHNQGEYKDITGNTSMLAAGYAFTPRLSLYAAYLNFTATDSANDSHTTLLAGNYRF
jgi:predicted porin